MSQPQRPRTAIDEIADDHFERSVQLSPLALTSLGRPQRQDELDDFSPAGMGALDELNRETLERLAQAECVDVTDKVTVAAMRERLGLAIARHERGYDLASINTITSGLHAIRETFDLMPTQTPEHWHNIAARLRAVPTAVVTWFISQHLAVEMGIRPARRQVEGLATAVDQWAGEGGFLDHLRSRTAGQSDEVTTDVARSIEVARRGFRQAAERLRREFGPLATEQDGVGIERYRLCSQGFLGTQVDLQETYRWGLSEVQRILELEQATAERIRPGASVREAVELLDADERYRLHGTEELQRWMQQRADAAVEAMGAHFDIPEPVRRIECCIAPTRDGGIYYTGPSEDFSRPGRMWWSVPTGAEVFTTWRELTTVHHEGVPGHHLQIGQTSFNSALLNTWRRHGCWVSGHGEGWALYSEWLMADLGFLDDPGDFMGLLDAQMLRAVRVVVDIGLHCADEPGFEAPELVGGGRWDFDKMERYFKHHILMDEGSSDFELSRYAGWPGQAPSYKLGERLWLQLRDEVKAARGEDFDLKDFHRTALDLGGLGLDVLRAAVLDLSGV